MKILYLTNAPIPLLRETDAHFQELDLLADEFGGRIISTFPLSKPNSLFPRSLYGMHNMFEIKKAAKAANLIHVFSPILHPFPFVRRLGKKPIVFSTMTPVSEVKMLNNVGHHIVYDESSKIKLIGSGIKSVSLSPPFVDFPKDSLSFPEGPFTILMASAPWEKSQFNTKGIHLLLDVLDRIPDLNITFIWRDILFHEMQTLVDQSRHKNRIRLINGRINIADHLAQAHAVVLLAEFSALVKSYPHSLMEGLLSGRPIVTTATIPISQDVIKYGYGEVLESFSLDALEHSLIELMNNFADYCEPSG